MSAEHRQYLQDIFLVTTMKNTSFETISPEDTYPTNEQEADEFIKNRIRNWLDTWVRVPIETILEETEDEI